MKDKTTFMERLLNRLFEKKEIQNCAHDIYLHRWYIFRSDGLAMFIHKFVRSDEDRFLHDHPWNFLVIPLWGGYIEHSDRRLSNNEACDEMFGWATSPESFAELQFRLSRRIAIKKRIWPIISSRYRDTKYRHRVELIKERPSWSIFFRFKKTREWGFWPKTGFILWNKWWQDSKCE